MSEAILTLDPEALASTAAGLCAWLLSGACQSASGAFVAWVDLGGHRAYAYPEISGYALTYLAGRDSLSELDYAAGHRAAEWLIERVQAGKLAARDGWDNDAVYLFDLGMIAAGLLSFGRRAGVERFVERGLGLAGQLRNELSSGISAISRSGPASGRDSWSTRGVPHLAKLVQAFLLAEESGFPGRPVAAELVDTVKRVQGADGRVPTHPDDPVMLHPHLYAAEGLWIWGSAVGDDDALARARAAVDWAFGQQLEQGGLPRSEADGERGAAADEQSDVTAQAVRLALALGSRSEAVDRAAARLVELTRSDGRALGIVYQPDSVDIHLNTWATLFAAQALALAVPDAPPLSWRELV